MQYTFFWNDLFVNMRKLIDRYIVKSFFLNFKKEKKREENEHFSGTFCENIKD